MTGTLWHGWAHEALVRTGMPFMQEVKLDRWLPEGWSGTADWVFWNADLGGFVLGDMKTIKGDGVSGSRMTAPRTSTWQLVLLLAMARRRPLTRPRPTHEGSSMSKEAQASGAARLTTAGVTLWKNSVSLLTSR
jgi:hypothetical protein